MTNLTFDNFGFMRIFCQFFFFLLPYLGAQESKRDRAKSIEGFANQYFKAQTI